MKRSSTDSILCWIMKAYGTIQFEFQMASYDNGWTIMVDTVHRYRKGKSALNWCFCSKILHNERWTKNRLKKGASLRWRNAERFEERSWKGSLKKIQKKRLVLSSTVGFVRILWEEGFWIVKRRCKMWKKRISWWINKLRAYAHYILKSNLLRSTD
jgi:hypothetical protein